MGVIRVDRLKIDSSFFCMWLFPKNVEASSFVMEAGYFDYLRLKDFCFGLHAVNVVGHAVPTTECSAPKTIAEHPVVGIT